ncbi:MAG TPA: hypothetical protein VKX49_24895 [Bryobacteraceae bacterium]|nr:hypothetical protein [Bryobacteraceae bacterium]
MTHAALKPDHSNGPPNLRLALLRAELELGFTYLRLATLEFQLHSPALAAEFLQGAILAHKTLARDLDGTRAHSDQHEDDLRESARDLLQTIVSTERQLHMLDARTRRPVTGPRY